MTKDKPRKLAEKAMEEGGFFDDKGMDEIYET